MTAPAQPNAAEIPLEVSAAINALEAYVRGYSSRARIADFERVHDFLTSRLDALRSAALLHEQGEQERKELRATIEQGERLVAELQGELARANYNVEEARHQVDGHALTIEVQSECIGALEVELQAAKHSRAFVEGERDQLANDKATLLTEVARLTAELRRLARNNPSAAD